MSRRINQKFKCVVHGSFGQHFGQIAETIKLFKNFGIKVIAPSSTEITAIKDGFLLLENEEDLDPIMVELGYLHKLQQLGDNGFSYFVNPGGYIGKSMAYELGIAQSANVACYFSHKPKDLPVYVPSSHILKPQDFIEYINTHDSLPSVSKRQSSSKKHKMFKNLVNPGSVVATGAIIQHQTSDKSLPEILLVKTHKWGHRYSIVGGKVRRNERLTEALQREIREETGLRSSIEQHIATFDQIKHSGYYQDYTHHMFVDYTVSVDSKRVKLNEEAQEYIWAPAEQALAELNIEPNARHTIEKYLQTMPI